MAERCIYLILLISFITIQCNVAEENDLCFSCLCNVEPDNSVADCHGYDLLYFPPLGEAANRTKVINLRNNKLRTINVTQYSWSLSNLSLKHNYINDIEPRAFENLPNLTYLDLSHNQLTSEVLKPLTFKGPKTQSDMLGLKVLNLASNALHTLYQDLFEFLPDIEELYLSSNPLRTLDHGTLVALSSIHKIRVLDFASTQLKDIPRNWLNAAKTLDYLNLASNSLTDIPFSLEESRGLRKLTIDHNPITIITHFPKVPSLEILEINWMPNLQRIRDHSFYNLTGLKELYISNNHYLEEISEDALVEPGISDDIGAVFPPLEKLDISNNRLGYLREELFGRWDNLKELTLDSNPWICDCENQWILARLIPIMNDKKIGHPHTLICGSPEEMKGKSMIQLAMLDYKMRCLDLYGNEPDKDAKVLIIVLVIVLTAIPVSLLFLHLAKRPRGQTGYPSAYYRRAQSLDSVY